MLNPISLNLNNKKTNLSPSFKEAAIIERSSTKKEPLGSGLIATSGAFGGAVGFLSMGWFDPTGYNVWKIIFKKIGIGIGLGLLTGYIVKDFDTKAEKSNNKKDFYEKCSKATALTGLGAIVGSTLGVVSAGTEHYFEWAKGKKFEYAGGMLGAMLFGAHAWMDVYQQYKHSKSNPQSL